MRKTGRLLSGGLKCEENFGSDSVDVETTPTPRCLPPGHVEQDSRDFYFQQLGRDCSPISASKMLQKTGLHPSTSP